MKKILFLTLILTGCGVKEKASESLTEKAIEAASGKDVDISNIAKNTEDQKFEQQISFDGKPVFGANKVFSGSVTIIKDNKGIGISGAYAGENAEQILWTVSQIKEGFTLPIVAKITNKDSELNGMPKALVMCNNFGAKDMYGTPMPFEGELKITKLKADLIEVEFNAKGGPATDAEKPDNWKPFTGKITMKNPVAISQGIEKSAVFQ